MYAREALTRKDIKALNRLDRRRKMKYNGKHDAEELRTTREEVEGTAFVYEDERKGPHHRHPSYHR